MSYNKEESDVSSGIILPRCKGSSTLCSTSTNISLLKSEDDLVAVQLYSNTVMHKVNIIFLLISKHFYEIKPYIETSEFKILA